MKKLLLGLFVLGAVSAVAADKGVNVYGRLGLDVSSRYHKLTWADDGSEAVSGKGKVAPSIAIEVTKNFTKNFCFFDKILVQKIIFEFFADFCSAY